MPERFNDNTTRLGDFANETLVECPHCRGRALVRCVGDEEASRVVLTCGGCGRSKVHTHKGPPPHEGTWFHSMQAPQPVDWYLKLPLWLQAPCCGETLWAWNAEHLEWLHRFVSATLRERTGRDEEQWSNKALASRLPPWMIKAKNRDKVLAAIASLRVRLD